MSLYPAAVQRPWHPYLPERYVTPRMVIVHTNACNAEDPGPTGTLSWNFQVGEHGVIYQHRDTNTRAAANADANSFAISIETWDGGDPEGNPWSAVQLDALVGLIRWCCAEHGIPTAAVLAWDGAGVGYHRQFPQWNQPTHSCPGDTRIAQFKDVVLPRIAVAAPAVQEDEMTPEQSTQALMLLSDLQKKVDDLESKALTPDEVESLFGKTNGLYAKFNVQQDLLHAIADHLGIPR